MKPSAEKRERGAKGTKRRALCFWSPLNSWLRAYQEENGKRPRPDQVQCWYDKHAADVWGDDKPSWTETRDHAKCVKPQAQIRSYFRKYRARQQAKKMLTAAQASPSTATTNNSAVMVPPVAYGIPAMDAPALMPGYGTTTQMGTASPPPLRGPHCGQPLMQHAAQQQHSMMPGRQPESTMQAAQAYGMSMQLKPSAKSSPFVPQLPAHQLELERIGSDLSSDSGFSHLSCASHCDSISNGGARAVRRGGAYMARMVPAAGCAEPMPPAAQPGVLRQDSPVCQLASSGEDSPAATWPADLAWSQHGNAGVPHGCHAPQQHQQHHQHQQRVTAERDVYGSYAGCTRAAAHSPGMPVPPRVQSVFGTASGVAAAAGGKLCIDPLMESSVDAPRAVFGACDLPSRPASALPGMPSLMGMCSQPHAASLLQTPTCSLMSSLLVNPACAEDANDGCMNEPFNSACFDDQLITNLGTPGFVL
uniref:Uncharacterized protein n=1 Tax=Chlamydomonas euryale TaxID=1486919 RepID=A0A7R9V1H5_9CHLO|mmetsp:Transcript_12992/g.37751  ORF Transcript_12992/g.37751 Transcript_12992/m.37751 type:complete len:476 (+) Transcript_12992:295-1722(+)